MAWGTSPQQFAAAILHGIGAPVTTANVHALMAWQRAEGGGARFNPFNTTQTAPGASSYNSVGVRNYTSYAQGLHATIQTLKNGYYPGVLAALHQGHNALAVAAAVGRSPWGTSGSLMASILGGKLPAVNPAQLAGGGAGSSLPPWDGSGFNAGQTPQIQPTTFLPPVLPTFATPAATPRGALSGVLPPIAAPGGQIAGLNMASLAPVTPSDNLQGLHDQLLKVTGA